MERNVASAFVLGEVLHELVGDASAGAADKARCDPNALDVIEDTIELVAQVAYPEVGEDGGTDRGLRGHTLLDLDLVRLGVVKQLVQLRLDEATSVVGAVRLRPEERRAEAVADSTHRQRRLAVELRDRVGDGHFTCSSLLVLIDVREQLRRRAMRTSRSASMTRMRGTLVHTPRRTMRAMASATCCPPPPTHTICVFILPGTTPLRRG